MSKGAKVLLRRIALIVISPLLLFVAVALFLFGSESGTRWTINQAIAYLPGKMSVGEIHGTFLRGLDIPRFAYENETIELTATDLTIRLDWLRSSLNRLYLKQLSANDIDLQAPGDPGPDSGPKPLRIAMPALPLGISVASIDIHSLRVNAIAASEIVAEDLDVRGAQISAASASGASAGVAVKLGDVSMRLEGEVPVRADVDWQYADGKWSGKGQLRGSLSSLAFDHELSGPYPASARGTAYLLGRIEPEVDASVSFDHWLIGPAALSTGKVHIVGTASEYRADIEVDFGYEQSLNASVAAAVTGNRNGLDSIDLTASGPAGQLAVRGGLTWLPGFSSDLGIQGRGLDPSQLYPLPAGKLDVGMRLQARSTEDFTAEIESLDGSYNQQPARAHGSLSRENDNWRCTGCDLSIGPDRVLVDGELVSDRLAVKLRVDAPKLQLLWPGLSGSLTADAQLRGNIALPVVSGQFSGAQVEWASWSATSFSVTSRSSTLENVDFDIGVDGLRHGDRLFGSGSARLSGDPGAVAAELQWSYKDIQAEAGATVSVDGNRLSAEVRSASIAEPFAGTWQLAGPMRFSLSPGELRTTPNVWNNGEARLNVEAFSLIEGNLETRASLAAVPLATLNIALPENVRLSGVADAELQLVLDTDGTRTGALQWLQRDTVVRIVPPQDQAIDIAVPVARADLKLVAGRLEGLVNLEVESGVRGSLEFTSDGFDATSAVTGRLQFSGEEWAWIPAFLPEIDDFKGTITTDIRASGRLKAPQLEGELHWQKGSLAVPALNIPLEQIDLTVAGSSAGSATVTGSAQAGRGKLVLDGRFEDLMQRTRSLTLHLGGQEATLVSWPDYRIVASPDLVFTGGQSGIRASGRLQVDRAEISVSTLPEGAVTPSADVSVAGRQEEKAENIPLSGEVTLALSENVHIKAFGLDTHVQGELKFALPEGREPTADGELKLVDGVFSAYGQQLTIDEGTMTFTGPLDDPIIYVRAVREIEGLSGTIKAGIELRGRAQNLSSSVFSSPTMSEADALSYLILGRPLEDATAADGSMLSGTAYALGLRQATVITSQIGQTLGLDQLAIAGSNQSTTALVAGKQINPRMYVRYAYGVFSQIGNLLLRYKLSKRLTIEAGTGESQSMDLLYLVEKP